MLVVSQAALQYAAEVSIIVLLAWVIYKAILYGRRDRDLPPGPPTDFVLGNILQMPRRDAYLKMHEWARQYGEVVSLKIGHQTIIVLNSPAAVEQLMVKGNNFTQGRPPMWLISDYVYKHDHLIFTDIPSKVGPFRRGYAVMLNAKSLARYGAVQEAESAQLLHDLLSDPGSYYTGIRRLSFSIMLSLIFGVRAPRWDSPSVEAFHGYIDILTHLMSVGSTPPLDLIPALQLLPESMAPWKKMATKLRIRQREFISEMMRVVRARLARDQKNGTFMEQALEEQSALGLTDNMVQMLGAEALSGGSDTTGCFLISAVMLLVGEHGIQERAQTELDRVVGPHRVPNLKDIPNLPYVRAIVKEIERMRAVTPLGIPHRATADQIYKGYRIPKDAMILVNCYAMGHDPDLFSDPEKFNPERFMDDMTPNIYPFGTGKRICPGKGLAMNTVNLVVARLLWGYTISNARDPATGKAIPVDKMDNADVVLLFPNRFPCEIAVRSAAHADTIRSDWREAAVPQLKLFEADLANDELAFLETQRGT